MTGVPSLVVPAGASTLSPPSAGVPVSGPAVPLPRPFEVSGLDPTAHERETVANAKAARLLVSFMTGPLGTNEVGTHRRAETLEIDRACGAYSTHVDATGR